MSTVSLRIDAALVLQAEREARVENRSRAKQLEYWAKLGRIISDKVNMADALAVSQGLKEVKLEMVQPVQPLEVSPDLIFSGLENDRKTGSLSRKVTSADIYYEASQTCPGMLDRVNTLTGERQTGQFENGRFQAA